MATTSTKGKVTKAPIIRPATGICCPTVSVLMPIINGINQAIVARNARKAQNNAKRRSNITTTT